MRPPFLFALVCSLVQYKEKTVQSCVPLHRLVNACVRKWLHSCAKANIRKQSWVVVKNRVGVSANLNRVRRNGLHQVVRLWRQCQVS